MEDTRISESTASMASRITLWGLTIVGFLGLILAITSAQSGEYVGSGVCLAASALAFGAIGYVFTKR